MSFDPYFPGPGQSLVDTFFTYDLVSARNDRIIT